jgi:hypothetical protein
LELNKKLTPNILQSQIRHENGDILKIVFNKKGEENFYLSNGSVPIKSIANFHETIPFSYIICCKIA